VKKILLTTLDRVEDVMQTVPAWLIALLARIAVANTFWSSVQTKISGWDFLGQSWQFWNLSQSTFYLFAGEYTVPLLPPNIAAYLATFGEFFLSITLLSGLLTRLSAAGLLCMTAVIQIFVYPDAWGVHIFWAACLLFLIKSGGGAVSMDHFLRRKTARVPA
jgi:putative oxidoreductase